MLLLMEEGSGGGKGMLTRIIFGQKHEYKVMLELWLSWVMWWWCCLWQKKIDKAPHSLQKW